MQIKDYEPLKLYRFGFQEIRYPVSVATEFHSGDEGLDKLFDASARTALLCTNDQIMDNSYREKQGWGGDIAQVVLTLTAAFGPMKMVERYFRMFMETQLPSRNLSSIVPGSYEGIFEQPMAIIWMAEVIRLTGNKKLAADYYPNILKYFSFLESFEDADGVIREVPWIMHIDWTNLCNKGTLSTLNFLYLRMVKGIKMILNCIINKIVKKKCQVVKEILLEASKSRGIRNFSKTAKLTQFLACFKENN